MKNCTLVIQDQVNAKFEDLDPFIRRKIVETCKYTLPYARHLPSVKIGRWDGTVAFATVGGGTYINILDRILPLVENAGYDIKLVDQRPAANFGFKQVDEFLLADKCWPEGHEMAGEPILLRDYQVSAINTFLANPQSIQEISTGSGKTIMTATLSMLCQPYGRTIVIVPSKSLVEQTEEDYRNLGLDVGVYYGDRKELGRTHTIATWQSLSVLAKNTRKQKVDFPIEEFVEGVVCVMVDEVHAAKAQELKTLLCGALAAVPLRWGLTGTVPKEDFDFMSILCALGPVVGHIKASELQEQGVLAKCEVDIVQLRDEHVEFVSYPDEHDWLTSDPVRLRWIADFVRHLAESGNTLTLVTRIDTGEQLRAMIPDSVFISGDVGTKKRRAEYKDVQVSDNKIIVATYGVAAVGINIPRIFNLVLIEPGKSFVRVIQSIGRGIRKAKDKDFVQITDIASTCKYSARHLSKRKGFYREANYPHAVRKITYR